MKKSWSSNGLITVKPPSLSDVCFDEMLFKEPM